MMQNETIAKCPYCGSVHISKFLCITMINANPDVVYHEVQCEDCLQWFTVKADYQDHILEVIKDFKPQMPKFQGKE